MPYLTPKDFTDLLAVTPEASLVNDYVFNGVPYVFRDRPAALNAMEEHLSSRLEVQKSERRLDNSPRTSTDGFPMRG
jgi:hypothetical protein